MRVVIKNISKNKGLKWPQWKNLSKTTDWSFYKVWKHSHKIFLFIFLSEQSLFCQLFWKFALFRKCELAKRTSANPKVKVTTANTSSKIFVTWYFNWIGPIILIGVVRVKSFFTHWYNSQSVYFFRPKR